MDLQYSERAETDLARRNISKETVEMVLKQGRVYYKTSKGKLVYEGYPRGEHIEVVVEPPKPDKLPTYVISVARTKDLT
jgi:hypothetical protein